MTMQTSFNFRLHPRFSVGLRVLLFTTPLTLGFPTISLAACAHYHTQMTQAVHSRDLNALEQLLPTLTRQPDCPLSYLDAGKRSMAQIVAVKADGLTQQNQLAEAEQLLKRAPTIVWNTQAVHGNIAALRRDWQKAAQLFNQTLDLMNNPQATPQAPTIIGNR